MEGGEPVCRGHDAHSRERHGVVDLSPRRRRHALGCRRADDRLRGRLLLPVLPQGGLPRHRARRRTLVVIVLAAAAAYVVGAVPVGYLVARLFGVTDIRRHGSGSIGATNVLRTAGRLPGLVTLAADIAKGWLAVTLAGKIGGDMPGALAVGAVAAVVGNCWSVFLGFRGGKGVATGLGALLRLAPWAVLPAIPVWLAVALTTRYVSLGSILGATCVPLGALLLGYPRPFVVAALMVAGLIIVRHHANIARLVAGTERRLREKRALPG